MIIITKRKTKHFKKDVRANSTEKLYVATLDMTGKIFVQYEISIYVLHSQQNYLAQVRLLGEDIVWTVAIMNSFLVFCPKLITR